jgi:hypothetical protein
LSQLIIAALAVDLNKKTAATMTLSFPDEKKAKDGIELAKLGLAEFNRAVMLFAYVCIKANQAGDKADKAFTGLAIPLIVIQKAVETATVKQKGATVEIALEADLSVEEHVALIRGIVKTFVKSEGSSKDQ